MKIDAVGLFVCDIKTSVAFYRDVVGMKTQWDGGPYAEFQADGGSRLIMYGRDDFEKMIASKLEYPEKINGTMELAFETSTFLDVDKEFKRLVEAGAKPVFAPTTMPWGQRTSYVADPDGNLIEIGSFGKKE